VLVGDVDSFCAHFRLDKAKMLRLAAGEVPEYKGWIAYPFAGSKYCDNRRPKPVTELPSLAEGLPGPVTAMLGETAYGDPLRVAPAILPTRTYKPAE
jgi:hypothetical protein